MSYSYRCTGAFSLLLVAVGELSVPVFVCSPVDKLSMPAPVTTSNDLPSDLK